jgi:translation initiation factor 3 subunit L
MSIPEPVEQFITQFYKAYLDNNVYELHGCYESQFNKLTEQFYKTTTWPSPLDIAELVSNDQVFLVLYSEMYYRHIYARLAPSLEHRTGSYNNYCNLFNLLLNNEDGPVSFELPNKWLWDIIDEFIYQFNQFAIYKSKLITSKGDSMELQYVQEHNEVWSSYSVLNALYSLISRSNIVEQLKVNKQLGAVTDVNITGDFGALPLYRTLGYFSIIGLLRIHTLLGDFTLALQTMDHIELDKRAFFTKIPGCHFTTYYYVGFCYLMLHRYSDAIKTFSHILLYISRTKNISRSGQYDVVSKKTEQMYALLVILVGICPTRLDDVLYQGIKEKFNDKYLKAIRGGEDSLPVYEELFKFASPRFISITNDGSRDPLQHHLKIFMLKINSIVGIQSLKPYLSLYSKLEVSKLTKLLDINEKELSALLLTYKMNNKQWKWSSGSLLSGELVPVHDLDIVVEDGLVEVRQSKNVRKFADWFVRNTLKNYAVHERIRG